MLTRALIVLAILLATLLIGGLATRPAKLLPSTDTLTLSVDLEAYLREQEALENNAFGVVPGAEKRVSWAGEAGAKTEYVVVYLHGFSATRQEIAPLPELLAKSLGANLFETRLTGHGRERQRLVDIPAEEWLRDGSEALAIGKALGEKLILVGTSTGATIAVAMAQHPQFSSVDSLVFISPNFGPAAAGSQMATGPYGPQLIRLLVGEFHEWQPANEQQGVYWTSRYPTTAIVQVMRLVNLADELISETRVPKAMLVYSPKDDVVSVDKLLAGFALLPATAKETLRIDEPRSLSPHVLTGDILAPGTAAELSVSISEFLLR